MLAARAFAGVSDRLYTVEGLRQIFTWRWRTRDNRSSVSPIRRALGDIALGVRLTDLEETQYRDRLQLMPELSRFLGISIIMYFNDHAPPHFHVRDIMNSEHRLIYPTLSLREGKIPPRVHGLVIERAELHQDELITNWNTLRDTSDFRKIDPLV